MKAAPTEDDFDVYAFVQAARAGRKITRPKRIVAETDERGAVTVCNQDGRPCVDDAKGHRVLLVADLRRSHPLLKPGILGRTLPNTSDFYRYVGVKFDNGVSEVVSVSAVQIVAEEAAKTLAKSLQKEIKGTVFDWDDDIARKKIREWEQESFKKTLDLSVTSRGGSGPHEVYAYTFPSLIALAEARGEEHYPVKIGYTGVANELSPSLTRIDNQFGEPAGRFEAAQILLLWNTVNGRALESRVHAQLRKAGRKVKTSIGVEWYRTHARELNEIIEENKAVDRSGLPLNGPAVESLEGLALPCRMLAQKITVLCTGFSPEGGIYFNPIEFDDLLEDSAPPEILQARPAADAEK